MNGPEEMWQLEITRGQNGYRLGYYEDIGEGGARVWQEEYIEDDEGDELKSGEELLWQVMNYFGFGGSKHDPERIRIIREKREIK